MASTNHSAFHPEMNQVLFEGHSSVKKVILNRPRKLNSLTYDMISQMTKKFKEFEDDSAVKLVILKGNGKAFCAGGDVIASYKYSTAGHWSFAASVYKKTLILEYLLATYQKPLVAFIDGIVMGSGAGLSMYTKFKIVSENTVFAMPEAGVGHFPDVGASHFLSRLPGFFGEYLGLTGAKLNGEEMVACGLATHFVHSKDLHLLENALQELASSDIAAITQVIRKFASTKIEKQDNFFINRLKIISKCFSGKSVEDILLALEKHIETRGEETWIVDAINSMKSASPTSLKICLTLIRKGRSEGLENCLVRDYTVFCHNLRRTVNNDHYEGIRAKLFDKDNNPKWQPSKVELVTKEMVDQYLSKIEEDDWEFLQLPQRLKFSDDINIIIKPKL